MRASVRGGSVRVPGPEQCVRARVHDRDGVRAVEAERHELSVAARVDVVRPRSRGERDPLLDAARFGIDDRDRRRRAELLGDVELAPRVREVARLRARAIAIVVTTFPVAASKPRIVWSPRFAAQIVPSMLRELVGLVGTAASDADRTIASRPTRAARRRSAILRMVAPPLQAAAAAPCELPALVTADATSRPGVTQIHVRPRYNFGDGVEARLRAFAAIARCVRVQGCGGALRQPAGRLQAPRRAGTGARATPRDARAPRRGAHSGRTCSPTTYSEPRRCSPTRPVRSQRAWRRRAERSRSPPRASPVPTFSLCSSPISRALPSRRSRVRGGDLGRRAGARADAPCRARRGRRPTLPPELESEPLVEDEVVLIGPPSLGGQAAAARRMWRTDLAVTRGGVGDPRSRRDRAVGDGSPRRYRSRAAVLGGGQARGRQGHRYRRDQPPRA